MSPQDPSISATPSRLPPHVVRVSPPPVLVVSAGLILFAILSVVGAGLLLVCMGLLTAGLAAPVGLGLLVLAAALGVWQARRVRRARERHRAWIEQLRAEGVDPLAIELAERWRDTAGISFETALNVLARHPPTEPARSHVVCFGNLKVPEVGELFFEPEIITPTRYFGWRLVVIPVACVIIALWLLQRLGVISILPPIRLGSLGYVLGMAVAVGGGWLWRAAIRPTYIRLAPGIIQIVQYRYGRSRPTIRSYPLDGRTTAFVWGSARGKNRVAQRLNLVRGDACEKIDLAHLPKDDPARERVWHALLSSAPIPRLSDEELVG